MYKYVITALFIALILMGILVFAQGAKASTGTLTGPQVAAVLELLHAFGVDNSTLEEVQNALAPKPVNATVGQVLGWEYVSPEICAERGDKAVYGKIPVEPGWGYTCK